MRLILLLVVLAIAACTTSEDMRNLRTGMTPEEVTAIMGPPDGVQDDQNVMVYSYEDRFVPFKGPNAANYYAGFVDGRLESWGVKSRNQSDSSSVILWAPPAN
jgi:hypothetical protein